MAVNIAHAAERKAFELALNSIITKGRESGDISKEILSLVDKIEKILGDSWQASSYDMLRDLANNPEGK